MNQTGEALSALSSGEYSRAKDLYGALLEEFPEEPDYICGFYTAAYWENRHTSFQAMQQGKTRGTALVQAWDAYETIANDKEFTGLTSFRAAMRGILGQAAEEFRFSFQDSGLAHDTKVLADVGRCLMRIGDYTNATEILQFARKVRPAADILFLLGESCAAQANEEPELLAPGLGFYRDAFIQEPAILDPSLIGSDLPGKVFQSVYGLFEGNRENAILWFPAHLMAASQRYALRKLLPEELKEIRTELGRLSQDLERVVEKYKERVRARICFFILVLLQHHASHEYHPEDIQELETKLAELNPGLYKDYRDAVQ
ncbi:MAG: tetratricopeptide repeat protein [Spirochaetia bacterium]|nr:tetratricopeptide repeat protein [Spirochaetia bacterium]